MMISFCFWRDIDHFPRQLNIIGFGRMGIFQFELAKMYGKALLGIISKNQKIEI